MVVVKTVRDFALQNEAQLRRFMRYKTGICDENMINDAIQEFYVRLIETNALGLYDETKGEFDTYISNLFCWMMPLLQRRNFRHRHATIPKKLRVKYGLEDPKLGCHKKAKFDYRMMSVIKKDDRMWSESDDVFNFVHENHASLKISKAYEVSLYDGAEDPIIDAYVEEFKAYIRRTEPSKRAERMILFIDQKFAGCRSVDIAGMMGVSNNMVKIIKQNLQRKYHRWQGALAN
jgi:DNA-directed RNA polymerase specialized sigma24 family protein